jgi:hypothetical protein
MFAIRERRIRMNGFSFKIRLVRSPGEEEHMDIEWKVWWST